MSQKSVNTHLALQEKLEGDSKGTLCGDGGTRKSNPECNFAPQEQPAPVPNDSPAIWPLVIADMRARDQLGRVRYGTPLQAHNGRDALRDAYEEALDLVVYLRQAIAERAGHEPPPAADDPNITVEWPWDGIRIMGPAVNGIPGKCVIHVEMMDDRVAHIRICNELSVEADLRSCDPSNLRAWCQRCHLCYDRDARRRQNIEAMS